MIIFNHLEEQHEGVECDVEGGHVCDLVHRFHLSVHHLAVDNSERIRAVNAGQKGRNLKRLIVNYCHGF